jgi:hypothetical protein
MKRLAAVAALLAVLLLWRWGGPSASDPGPGVRAADPPQQYALADASPFEHGAYRITPLAGFGLRARVLGREDYRFDAEAGLSPTDLALGWGRMSDSAVLAGLAIRQSGRFYHYRWGSDGPPIPAAEIVRSSANMHLVPADAGVAAMLGRVRRGDIVVLEGQLIEARRSDGWRWRSSLSREDSGHGACELVWVTALLIEPAAG